MCHERERLIEYVYDECDAGSHRAIAAHLETCAGCRDEVRSLRDTRQDLLAWEVPYHESVWRPFAPAQTTVWWRQVPAWALATAASVMFVCGLAGGVVAQTFLAPGDSAERQASAEGVSTSAATGDALSGVRRIVPTSLVSSEQLTATEQRILNMLREDLARVNHRVRQVSGQAGGLGETMIQTTTEQQQLLAQLEKLRLFYNEQYQLNQEFTRMYSELNDRVRKLDTLEKSNADAIRLMNATSIQGGGGQ
jgi:hypothetical protein